MSVHDVAMQLVAALEEHGTTCAYIDLYEKEGGGAPREILEGALTRAGIGVVNWRYCECLRRACIITLFAAIAGASA